VDTYQGQSLFATARDVVLPNGWHATASLSNSRGTNLRHGVANLYLDVWTTYPCWGEVCESHSSASADLSPAQVDMDRSLRTASVSDVSVELVDPATWVPDPLPDGEGPGNAPEPWTGEDPGTVVDDPGTVVEDPGTVVDDPGNGEDPWTGEDPDVPLPVEPEPMTLTVSLAFTGTGLIDRTANHYNMCGDGDRECQAIRVEAQRAAVAQLVIGDQRGRTTDGSLFFGRFIDAAAPKFAFDEY
jgi:hypothetical protein